MKHTTDYIARVEKAMSEKYGKEAVQDFRNDWSEEKEAEYLKQSSSQNRNRKSTPEKISLSEDIVVSQRAATKRVERTCPVCKTYSFSTKDDLYMARYQSCHRCYVHFVEGREERWEAGWRPTESRITALKDNKNG